MEFWLISRPDTATPPAFTALDGAITTPFSCMYLIASLAHGMLDVSTTNFTP